MADASSPLGETTFCVVDVETTGTSCLDDRITEVGAVTVRRGETTGTFQTLVDPEQPTPISVRLVTGISETMLEGAPSEKAVLPYFVDFARGSVLVAHNARFDMSFLNAALARDGRPLQERAGRQTARSPPRQLGPRERRCRHRHLPSP